MHHNHQQDLQELAATVTAFEACLPVVEASGRKIVEQLASGNKLMSAGNGGSATDALHVAEELTGRYKGDRAALPGLCLSADISALTCIANDYGFESIFSRQIEAFGKPGDVFIGFTTSGNSENILKAFEACKTCGVITILLSGKGGGKAKGMCDYEVIVPSNTTARIQELHTFVLHAWLEMVEAEDWTDDVR